MPDKLDKPVVAEETPAKAVEPVAKDTPPVVETPPACPHCGQPLRPEHDFGDHLHCDSKDCISCCFDPGEPPTLRAHFPHCPAAG